MDGLLRKYLSSFKRVVRRTGSKPASIVQHDHHQRTITKHHHTGVRSECYPDIRRSVLTPEHCLQPNRISTDKLGCSVVSLSSPASVASGASVSEEISSMAISRRTSFRWLLPRAPQRRLVYKSGECNISRINIDKQGIRYLADIFTTLVDIKWRWNLLIFAMVFTLSWIIFAFVWWLICFAHGDMAHYGEQGWKPCVAEVYDFSTALLFSIETQQTIGYGTRCMNPHCPEAIVIVMFQSCFGIVIQALMTGLVFAKLSRPKKRAQTLMFSKNALICERDRELCFLFRVGDMRKSHIVEAQVRAMFVSKRLTKEGEVLSLYQQDLHLDETDGRLFLVWPITVEHRITSDSPLWDVSFDNIQRRHFEILVILEGIVESTGMTTQARTSYLPSEILWGHRFERIVSYHRESGQYVIDYSRFNQTQAVEMLSASAKERSNSAEQNKNDLNGNCSEDDTVSDTEHEPSHPTQARLDVPVDGLTSAALIGRSSVSSTRTIGLGAALAAFELENEFPGNTPSICSNAQYPNVDTSNFDLSV